MKKVELTLPEIGMIESKRGLLGAGGGLFWRINLMMIDRSRLYAPRLGAWEPCVVGVQGVGARRAETLGQARGLMPIGVNLRN